MLQLKDGALWWKILYCYGEVTSARGGMTFGLNQSQTVGQQTHELPLLETTKGWVVFVAWYIQFWSRIPRCLLPSSRCWQHVAGTSQHLETLWAIQTEEQQQCWCEPLSRSGLKPDFDSRQLAGKYFSSPITGYKQQMEASCTAKGKRNQSDSWSYTRCSSYSGAAS